MPYFLHSVRMTNPQIEEADTAEIEAKTTAPPPLPSFSISASAGAVADGPSTTEPEIETPNKTTNTTAFATTSGAVTTLGGEDSERTVAATAAEGDKTHNDDRTESSRASTATAEPTPTCSRAPEKPASRSGTGANGNDSSPSAATAGGTYRFQSQLPKLQVQ